MTIYNNTIPPTYLYIKQHALTGLKYFGITSCDDPIKYTGSGTYWKRHINKHGKEHIKTIWLSEPYTDKELINEIAIHFSIENNIAKSKEWANLILENGRDGVYIRSTETRTKSSISAKNRPPITDETRAKLSVASKNMSKESRNKVAIANTGRIVSNVTRGKLSIASTGRVFSKEWRANISKGKTGKQLGADNPLYGKHHTVESKQKMSERKLGQIPWNKGITHSDSTKKIQSDKAKTRQKIECPHCGIVCDVSNHTRWHGDNCKLRP